MEVSSSHQMYVFLLCVLSGLGCGVFFDVQRSIRSVKRAGNVRTLFEDLLFALICVLTAVAFGYFFNSGQMRYYQVMGFLSGILFYAAFLSRLTMRLMDAVYSAAVKFFIIPAVKFVRMVLVPFRKLFTLAKVFLLKIRRLLRKIFVAFKLKKKILKKRMKML